MWNTTPLCQNRKVCKKWLEKAENESPLTGLISYGLFLGRVVPHIWTCLHAIMRQNVSVYDYQMEPVVLWIQTLITSTTLHFIIHHHVTLAIWQPSITCWCGVHIINDKDRQVCSHFFSAFWEIFLIHINYILHLNFLWGLVIIISSYGCNINFSKLTSVCSICITTLQLFFLKQKGSGQDDACLDSSQLTAQYWMIDLWLKWWWKGEKQHS